MKIYIGSDHNGFHLRGELIKYLKRAGYDVEDDGNLTLDPEDDYPVITTKVVNDVLASDDDDPRGILICGSGQGMCMAANRFRGIRACMGYDLVSVKATRNDEDSNVLCLAARVLQKDTANQLVEAWLNTPFAKVGRFQRRINELDDL